MDYHFFYTGHRSKNKACLKKLVEIEAPVDGLLL